MNRKKLITGIVLAAILLGTGSYLFLNRDKTPAAEQTPETIPEETADPRFEEYHAIWQDNYNINHDYVGEFFFDSGLINVSFVQAKSVYRENGELYRFFTEDGRLVSDPTGYSGNDVYIWTYWKTGEYDYNDNGGSVFLDYRNDLRDQNLILYGHHFSVWNDQTRTKAFTPLEQLMEEENYAANKTATMVLQDEIRHYELASVYQFEDQDNYWEDYQFWRSEYNYDDYTGESDDGYYQRYIDGIKQIEFYDTGVKLTTDDKTLTLQTCISGHTGEWWEIVVFRLTDVEKY